MKVKCGTDIIEVKRFMMKSDDEEKRFFERVFTSKEIQYCNSTKAMKYQHYAARFAAKEAIFKAVSDLLDSKYDLSWKNVQILNDENGRPYVEFLNIKLDKLQSIDISLSHIKEYAIAYCVAYIND